MPAPDENKKIPPVGEVAQVGTPTQLGATPQGRDSRIPDYAGKEGINRLFGDIYEKWKPSGKGDPDSKWSARDYLDALKGRNQQEQQQAADLVGYEPGQPFEYQGQNWTINSETGELELVQEEYHGGQFGPNGEPLPKGAAQFDAWGRPFFGPGLGGVIKGIKYRLTGDANFEGGPLDYWGAMTQQTKEPMAAEEITKPFDVYKDAPFLEQIGPMVSMELSLAGNAWEHLRQSKYDIVAGGSRAIQELLGGFLYVAESADDLVRQFLTPIPLALRYGDTVEEAGKAAVIGYTALASKALYEEAQQRIAAGEAPALVKADLQNPLVGMVGDIVMGNLLNPFKLLKLLKFLNPGGLRAMKAAKSVLASDEFVEMFDLYRTASKAEKGSRLDDLVGFVQRTVKDFEAKDVIKFANDRGVIQMTAVGKRSTWSAHMTNFIMRQVAESVEDPGAFMRGAENIRPNLSKIRERLMAVAYMYSNDPKLIKEGVAVLEKYPDWQTLMGREAQMTGRFLWNYAFGPEAQKDPEWIINLLEKYHGKPEELVTQINKTMKPFVEGMFPSIDDLIEEEDRLAKTIKQGKIAIEGELGADEAVRKFLGREPVGALMRKVAKINTGIKEGFYGPINGFLSSIYMGMSPAYAARNFMSNQMHLFTDFGLRAILRQPSAADNLTQSWLGFLPYASVQAFGGPIAGALDSSFFREGRWRQKIFRYFSDASARLERKAGKQVVAAAVDREMTKFVRVLSKEPGLAEALGDLNSRFGRDLYRKLLERRGNVDEVAKWFKESINSGYYDKFRGLLGLTDEQYGMVKELSSLNLEDRLVDAIEMAAKEGDQKSALARAIESIKEDIRQAKNMAAHTPPLRDTDMVDDLIDGKLTATIGDVAVDGSVHNGEAFLYNMRLEFLREATKGWGSANEEIGRAVQLRLANLLNDLGVPIERQDSIIKGVFRVNNELLKDMSSSATSRVDNLRKAMVESAYVPIRDGVMGEELWGEALQKIGLSDVFANNPTATKGEIMAAIMRRYLRDSRDLYDKMRVTMGSTVSDHLDKMPDRIAQIFATDPYLQNAISAAPEGGVNIQKFVDEMRAMISNNPLYYQAVRADGDAARAFQMTTTQLFQAGRNYVPWEGMRGVYDVMARLGIPSITDDGIGFDARSIAGMAMGGAERAGIPLDEARKLFTTDNIVGGYNRMDEAARGGFLDKLAKALGGWQDDYIDKHPGKEFIIREAQRIRRAGEAAVPEPEILARAIKSVPTVEGSADITFDAMRGLDDHWRNFSQPERVLASIEDLGGFVDDGLIKSQDDFLKRLLTPTHSLRLESERVDGFTQLIRERNIEGVGADFVKAAREYFTEDEQVQIVEELMRRWTDSGADSILNRATMILGGQVDGKWSFTTHWDDAQKVFPTGFDPERPAWQQRFAEFRRMRHGDGGELMVYGTQYDLRNALTSFVEDSGLGIDENSIHVFFNPAENGGEAARVGTLAEAISLHAPEYKELFRFGVRNEAIGDFEEIWQNAIKTAQREGRGFVEDINKPQGIWRRFMQNTGMTEGSHQWNRLISRAEKLNPEQARLFRDELGEFAGSGMDVTASQLDEILGRVEQHVPGGSAALQMRLHDALVAAGMAPEDAEGYMLELAHAVPDVYTQGRVTELLEKMSDEQRFVNSLGTGEAAAAPAARSVEEIYQESLNIAQQISDGEEVNPVERALRAWTAEGGGKVAKRQRILDAIQEDPEAAQEIYRRTQELLSNTDKFPGDTIKITRRSGNFAEDISRTEGGKYLNFSQHTEGALVTGGLNTVEIPKKNVFATWQSAGGLLGMQSEKELFLGPEGLLGAISAEGDLDIGGLGEVLGKYVDELKPMAGAAEEIVEPITVKTTRRVTGNEMRAWLEEQLGIVPTEDPMIAPLAPGATPNSMQMINENYDGLMSMLDDIKDTLLKNWGNTEMLDDLGIEDMRKIDDWAKLANGRMSEGRAVASEVAQEARKFTLLTYNERRGFDAALGYIYPYQFWYTRSYANWITRIAQNPQIAMNYARWRNYLEHKNYNLPDWWKQNLEVGSILGVDLKSPLFFNLEATLNPLYGLVGPDFESPARRESQFGKVIDDLGRYGPTVWTPFVFAAAVKYWTEGKEDSAAAMAGRFMPQTRLIHSILGTTDLPPYLKEPDPFVWMFSGGVDYWERRRIGRALAGMEMRGDISPEQAADAAYSQSGPIWQQAQNEAIGDRRIADIMGSVAGVGFKGRKTSEMIIDMMYTDINMLYTVRDNMDKDTYAQAWAQLREKYPFMDSVLLSRKPGPVRDKAMVYNVLSRIPPGEQSQWVGWADIPSDLVNKFYDEKGEIQNWNESDRGRLMSGVLDLAAVLTLPRGTRMHEWNGARMEYRILTNTMDEQFGEDISNRMDTFYQMLYEADDQDAMNDAYRWLDAHPDVSSAIDWKAEHIINNPILNNYYGGIDAINRYYKSLMYADAKKLFGEDIFELQQAYWDVHDSGGNTKQFLKDTSEEYGEHGRLLDYWDWKDGQVDLIDKKMVDFGDSVDEIGKAILRDDIEAETFGIQSILAGYQQGKEELMSERDLSVSQFAQRYIEGARGEELEVPPLTSAFYMQVPYNYLSRYFSEDLQIKIDRYFENGEPMGEEYKNQLRKIWNTLGQPGGNFTQWLRTALRSQWLNRGQQPGLVPQALTR